MVVNAVFSTNTMVYEANTLISSPNKVEKSMFRMFIPHPDHFRQIMYPRNWMIAPPNNPRNAKPVNFAAPRRLFDS